jgi:hypothetical protein
LQEMAARCKVHPSMEYYRSCVACWCITENSCPSIRSWSQPPMLKYMPMRVAAHSSLLGFLLGFVEYTSHSHYTSTCSSAIRDCRTPCVHCQDGVTRWVSSCRCLTNRPFH